MKNVGYKNRIMTNVFMKSYLWQTYNDFCYCVNRYTTLQLEEKCHQLWSTLYGAQKVGFGSANLNSIDISL